jgi:hypothetical protein
MGLVPVTCRGRAARKVTSTCASVMIMIFPLWERTIVVKEPRIRVLNPYAMLQNNLTLIDFLEEPDWCVPTKRPSHSAAPSVP